MDAALAKSIPCQATLRRQISLSHTLTLNTSFPLLKVFHTQTSYSLQLIPCSEKHRFHLFSI